MFEVYNQDPVVHRVYDHSRMNDAGYCWRKVFVIDNFYENPDEIRDYALSCDLKSDKVKKRPDQLIRNYGIGAQIIKSLKIKNMILVTRSLKKVVGLEGFDIKIVKQEIIK